MSPAAEKPSLYILKDGLYAPQEGAINPWDHALQSGIALAGMLTRALEQAEEPAPMVLARVTIDIMRRVPFAPVSVRTETTRAGRQMQNVDAFVEHNGVVVARASGLKVRRAENPRFPGVAPEAPPPDQVTNTLVRRDGVRSPLETRLITGGYEGGPSLVWSRPSVDFIPGEPVSPTAGAAMVSDIGGGMSGVLDRDHWTFFNVDLSINFSRAPVSEWILMSSVTTTEGNGVGLAVSTLSDESGYFGAARQIQFVAPKTSK